MITSWEDRAAKNNDEGKCAGCGIFFRPAKNQVPGETRHKWEKYEWCSNCYERRLVGIRPKLEGE